QIGCRRGVVEGHYAAAVCVGSIRPQDERIDPQNTIGQSELSVERVDVGALVHRVARVDTALQRHRGRVGAGTLDAKFSAESGLEGIRTDYVAINPDYDLSGERYGS